jgi:hypothetical protein
MQAHQKGIEGAFQEEYVVPKKPVDRHFIGAAWSRQFGPVEEPGAGDIRVKKERSLNAIQQDFALRVGLAAGAQSSSGQSVEAGVEIISPVSLADIPFRPGVPYVTEALRLANFRIRDEASAQLGGSATVLQGSRAATGSTEVGYRSGGATEGEGLVVAYRLHAIDMKGYESRDTGAVPLELDRSVELPAAGVIAKSRLLVIDPGAGRPLPRNLLWACPRADAQSRDVVAAWLVELRPTGPGAKGLTIAFPAHPRIEDCGTFSGVLSSRIDPVTDRIHRQRMNLVIVEGEVDDAMAPARFEARLSIIDESFRIRPVPVSEAGGGGAVTCTEHLPAGEATR